MSRRRSWILVAVALLPVAYQLRYSISTVEATQTFLFLPFRLKQFTNVVDSVAMPARYDAAGMKVGLQRGDELIAVNGRKFVGISILAQELRSARRYLDGINRIPPQLQMEAILRWPFFVKVRSGQIERTTPVYFADCSCGMLSQSRVWWYSILPPAACALAGLIVIAFGRAERRNWAFFGLALCLSQIALAPGGFGSWSIAADPTEWRDWFRVPALAYHAFFTSSWPAWLMLYACYSFPPWNNRFTKLVTALLFAIALFDTGLTVGWSEAFRPATFLNNFAQAAKPFVTPLAILVAGLTAFRLGRRCGIVAVSAAVVSIAALNAPVMPFELVRYANTGEAYVELAHPLFLFQTSEVIVTAFAVVVVFAAIAENWRSPDLLRDAGLLFILAAVTYRAASTVWGVWWMKLLPDFALGAIYAGVILSVLSLLRGTLHQMDSAS